jgi:NADH:ubiquinone oxidoreductase subunit 4 (subunit M)
VGTGIVVFGVYPQLMFRLFDPGVELITEVFRR